MQDLGLERGKLRGETERRQGGEGARPDGGIDAVIPKPAEQRSQPIEHRALARATLTRRGLRSGLWRHASGFPDPYSIAAADCRNRTRCCPV